MNLFFYLGIDHIDLGKSVAIEFLGPIAVAAATTRTDAQRGRAGAGGRRRDHARRRRARRQRARRVLHPALVGDVGAVHRRRVACRADPARRCRARRGAGDRDDRDHAGRRARRAGRCGRRPTLLVLCCATGVFSNAIGYGIDQYVLRRIPVRRFSVLLALLPVTALVVGWVALDQQPSALDLVGHARRARRRRPAGPRGDPPSPSRNRADAGSSSEASEGCLGVTQRRRQHMPNRRPISSAMRTQRAVVVVVVTTWSR